MLNIVIILNITHLIFFNCSLLYSVNFLFLKTHCTNIKLLLSKFEFMYLTLHET